MLGWWESEKIRKWESREGDRRPETGDRSNCRPTPPFEGGWGDVKARNEPRARPVELNPKKGKTADLDGIPDNPAGLPDKKQLSADR